MCVGGGGTLIFPYGLLGPFFGVQNFDFQYFFGFLLRSRYRVGIFGGGGGGGAAKIYNIFLGFE